MKQEIEILKDETNHCTAVTKDIIVHNQVTYEKASEFLKGIKTLQKKIEEFFKPICESAYKNWKATVEARDKQLEPTKQAEENLKIKIGQYVKKVEKERMEEQARLDRIAKEKSDKERQKLLDRADKADASGKVEKAEELKELASNVEATSVVAISKISRVSGITTKKKYSAEVADFSKMPDEYKLPNMPMLNGLARSSNGKIVIAGVRMIEDDVVVAGIR